MKTYWFGFSLIFIGAILLFVLIFLKVPRPVSCGVGLIIISIGFVIQIVSIFQVKNNAEKEAQYLADKHTKLLNELSALPPAEQIRKLLTIK